MMTMQQLSDLLRIIQLALTLTSKPAPPPTPQPPQPQGEPARDPVEEELKEQKRMRLHHGIKTITEFVLKKLAQSLENHEIDKKVARSYIEELSRVSLYKILYKKELEDITQKYAQDEEEGSHNDSNMAAELVEIFREKFPQVPN